jgi:hypothetical protein
MYKLLLDRWLGPPIRTTSATKSAVAAAAATSIAGESKAAPSNSSHHAALAAAHAFESDEEALQPPFPLSRFFSDFRLNRDAHLGASVQRHLHACGLSTELTLEDLLQFALGAAKSIPRTHAEMKVDYEWQRDQRVRGKQPNPRQTACASARLCCELLILFPLLRKLGCLFLCHSSLAPIHSSLTARGCKRTSIIN